MINQIIIEPARQLPVAGSADVIVCGAGPAGVCAAIAAARAGAKTCLIESAGCLGGAWTAGLMGWIIDHQNKGGLLQELKNAICCRGGTSLGVEAMSMPFDIEIMKLLLEDKCREAGVMVRLHTMVAGVIKEADGRISAVVTESKSGREAWLGKVIIDATGDGDVACCAGCDYELGNPENGLTQPMSLLCLITGLDIANCREYVIGYAADVKQAKNLLRNELEAGGAPPSYAFPS
ncbi:MAG: FAD-dependent oxidoreductase, partial [Victivallaceae bacterium]